MLIPIGRLIYFCWTITTLWAWNMIVSSDFLYVFISLIHAILDDCLYNHILQCILMDSVFIHKTNENAWALTRPPATCPLYRYICLNVIKWCQDVILWHHVTSWRHVVTSHDVLCHNKKALSNLHRSHHKNIRKSRFSKWRPWPLTYDLDLRTRPRYYQRQCPCQILGP